jgi:hypothetical protein
MIKYKIRKTVTTKTGSPNIFNKTIKKSELDLHLKDNWFIVEKIIPLITPVSKWWNKFSIGNKIAILAIFIPILFGGIYFCLDNKYENLKQNYTNLKIENNSLNKRNLILFDSINKLNEIIESKQK